MNKWTSKAEIVVADTKTALQTVYDSLNQGQQKKIVKDEKVKALVRPLRRGVRGIRRQKMSELTIWRRLKEYGLTDAGAAGVMGNMRAESGLCAHRLQSDFTQGYTKSLEYTRAVDAGEKNESFVADCKGYGLCQWTSKGRKAGLLQFAQWQNLSIGDEQMQADYVWKELNGGAYPVLLKTLTTGDSVAKAASDVCTVYERPYICNTVERTKYAQEYYDKYAGSVQGEVICATQLKKQHLRWKRGRLTVLTAMTRLTDGENVATTIAPPQ